MERERERCMYITLGTYQIYFTIYGQSPYQDFRISEGLTLCFQCARVATVCCMLLYVATCCHIFL